MPDPVLDYTYPTVATQVGVTMKGRSSAAEMQAAVTAFNGVAEQIVTSDATLAGGFINRVANGYATLKTAIEQNSPTAPDFTSNYRNDVGSVTVTVDTAAILAQYGLAMSSAFGGGHNNAYAYSTILGFEQKLKAEELRLKSLAEALASEHKAYEIKVNYKTTNGNQALVTAASVPIINPADITLVSDVNASNIEANNALQIRAQQIRQAKAAGTVLASVTPDAGTNPRPFEEIMTSASIRAVGAASNTE